MGPRGGRRLQFDQRGNKITKKNDAHVYLLQRYASVFVIPLASIAMTSDAFALLIPHFLQTRCPAIQARTRVCDPQKLSAKTVMV